MRILTVLLLMLMLPLNFIVSQETNDCSTTPFEVYLDDEDNYSNIRERPNGTIVLKINNEDSNGYILNVIDFKNGWFKINEINGVDGYTISEFSGWIHSSIVGIALTHDVDLFDEPNRKKILELTGETGETFKITDVYCDWVKIKTKEGEGWVESEKLCSNPVTTCP